MVWCNLLLWLRCKSVSRDGRANIVPERSVYSIQTFTFLLLQVSLQASYTTFCAFFLQFSAEKLQMNCCDLPCDSWTLSMESDLLKWEVTVLPSLSREGLISNSLEDNPCKLSRTFILYGWINSPRKFTLRGLELQPIELFGQKVDMLPPLAVDFTWLMSLIRQLVEVVPGLDSLDPVKGDVADDDSPGYFDVEYLDDELLIIRQQAPGGVFALAKVDSCNP